MGPNLRVIPLAKVALLPKSKQANPVSSFIFQGITFVAGEPAQEVPTDVGVTCMTDSNMVVEFTESDFKDLPDKYLNKMAERLNVPVKEVKKTVLPKKAVTTKVKDTVKTTLAGVKPKPVETVEEPVEEEVPIKEETSEEALSDE